MKKRTIARNIETKMNAWIKSLPDDLQNPVKSHLIVTGGAIVSMLENQMPKDFDVYFSDIGTCNRITDHYAKLFMDNHPESKVQVKPRDENQPDGLKKIHISAGTAGQILEAETSEDPVEDIKTDDKGLYLPVFLSSNAITLSDKVQVVIRFVGEAATIHENFDFVHCTHYWTFQEGLVLKQDALESFTTKTLKYIGSKYPICSVIRIKKFLKRGWTISAGEMLKMMFQISHLDLNNIDVLEDQLTGVDSAYFSKITDSIREKKEKDPSFVLTFDYLASILDRIFGD